MCPNVEYRFDKRSERLSCPRPVVLEKQYFMSSISRYKSGNLFGIADKAFHKSIYAELRYSNISGSFSFKSFTRDTPKSFFLFLKS